MTSLAVGDGEGTSRRQSPLLKRLPEPGKVERRHEHATRPPRDIPHGDGDGKDGTAGKSAAGKSTGRVFSDDRVARLERVADIGLVCETVRGGGRPFETAMKTCAGVQDRETRQIGQFRPQIREIGIATRLVPIAHIGDLGHGDQQDAHPRDDAIEFEGRLSRAAHGQVLNLLMPRSIYLILREREDRQTWRDRGQGKRHEPLSKRRFPSREKPANRAAPSEFHGSNC